MPSYNEITTKPKKAKKPAEDNSDLSADEGAAAVDDEGFDDKADEFETKYNFRFEEPYVYFSFHSDNAFSRLGH